MVIESKGRFAVSEKKTRLKFLSFLYGAHLTRRVKVVRLQDGESVFVDQLDICTTRCKRLANLYHRASTLVHLSTGSFFLFVRCFQDLYSSTASNYLVRCYSPRLILGQYMELKNCASIAALMSGLNIIYRCLALYQLHGHENTLISFLLADDEQQLFQRSLLSGSTRHRTPSPAVAKVMLYQFRDPVLGKFSLRLRPNRDASSRRHLFRLIDAGFDLIVASTSLFLAAYLLSGVAMTLVHQEALYIGCATVGHFGYLLRNSLSLILLLVHALDNLLFVNLSVANLPLLVYDINKYLSRLRLKTESLRSKLCSFIHDAPESDLHEEENARIWRREIADIQANFVDFFAQVRQADVYVSMLIPFSLFVWTLCNAFLTLSGIQTETGNLAIRLFQCIGFLLSGLISCCALEFKRRVERLYTPLCSLMAMDQSAAGNRLRWLPVLMFYTDQEPRYAFTLCGRKIYTRLAYLTYLSYTLTFALFVESLRTTSARGYL